MGSKVFDGPRKVRSHSLICEAPDIYNFKWPPSSLLQERGRGEAKRRRRKKKIRRGGAKKGRRGEEKARGDKVGIV